MRDFDWRPLGEICKFIDYRGKTPKKTKKGIPLITAKIIKNGFIEKFEEFIAEEDYESWMRRGIPEYGAVVFTTEAPLGEVAQIKSSEKVALAQRVITMMGIDQLLDNNYLKYALQFPPVKSDIQGRASGTTVQGIKSSELKKVKIPLPEYEVQVKIGEILGSIDDKIELNRRMNETLEQMAMALYKHWFVDGEVYQDVPNGKVEDFAKIIGGGTPKTSVDEYWGGDIPWVSVKDLSDTFVYNTEKTITEKGLQESSTKLIPKHATIVSARGTVGELSITGRPMAMNQSCYAFYSNELPFFTYLTLKFSIDTLKKNSHGSVFSTITRETINLLDVPYDPDVCSDFEKKVDSLFFQIDSNIRENMILIQTRDYLLPRLLSGKIEVKEAEEQVEEVLANA